MNFALKFIIFLFVLLQNVKAQTFITLAPQSNCPNNFYIDYIAKAKIQQLQLLVSGELIANGDSILQINFSLENNSSELNKSFKENIKWVIEKAKWKQEKMEQIFYYDKTKKLVVLTLNSNKLNGKNEVAVYINVLEKSTSDSIKKSNELILICTAIYKNGCKYIKKQKIIFNNLNF